MKSTINILYGSVNNEMQNVSNNCNKSRASGSEPITIQGVTFANTLAVNKAKYSKNFGCKFHGDETDRNCCFHPKVFQMVKAASIMVVELLIPVITLDVMLTPHVNVMSQK